MNKGLECLKPLNNKEKPKCHEYLKGEGKMPPTQENSRISQFHRRKKEKHGRRIIFILISDKNRFENFSVLMDKIIRSQSNSKMIACLT